jgi:hypothetical protein
MGVETMTGEIMDFQKTVTVFLTVISLQVEVYVPLEHKYQQPGIPKKVAIA